MTGPSRAGLAPGRMMLCPGWVSWGGWWGPRCRGNIGMHYFICAMYGLALLGALNG